MTDKEKIELIKDELNEEIQYAESLLEDRLEANDENAVMKLQSKIEGMKLAWNIIRYADGFDDEND